MADLKEKWVKGQALPQEVCVRGLAQESRLLKSFFTNKPLEHQESESYGFQWPLRS